MTTSATSQPGFGFGPVEDNDDDDDDDDDDWNDDDDKDDDNKEEEENAMGISWHMRELPKLFWGIWIML